jgi:hypothetical protein
MEFKTVAGLFYTENIGNWFGKRLKEDKLSMLVGWRCVPKLLVNYFTNIKC